LEEENGKVKQTGRTIRGKGENSLGGDFVGGSSGLEARREEDANNDERDC